MSATAYPYLGGVDGQRDGIIDLADVDSALFTAPNSVATMTAFKAQITSMTGAGSIQISLEGTTYVIPMLANEDTAN